MRDITDLFKETNSHVIQEIINKGGVVLGIKAENFQGVLINDKRFSDELSKEIEKKTGVRGFISTDELPKYGIRKEDKRVIEDSFGCQEKDIVIIVADQKEKAEEAISMIEEAIKKRNT